MARTKQLARKRKLPGTNEETEYDEGDEGCDSGSESADSHETMVTCECKIRSDEEESKIPDRLSVRRNNYHKLQLKTRAQKQKIMLLEAKLNEKKKKLRRVLHLLLEETF